jgi:hypothetical protein
MYPDEDDYGMPPHRSEVLFTFFVITLFGLFLLLTGCVKVQPEIKPQLGSSCPKLNMPAVPQKMKLGIDGEKIDADPEGEEFLRQYVRARQLLR